MAVHDNVSQSLRYILNPEKTEDRLLTSSINCMTEPEYAYPAMKAVYNQYAKDRIDTPPPKSGKGTVKAIHYMMSFADSENVTPEVAHKIGKAFVRKMFGDDAVAVIATHVNTGHIHNHILVCSYSLSGQKFYDNMTTVHIMRENTNGICRAFGIEPALNFENEGRSLNYSEWQHRKKGTSWKEQIRNEIDDLIPAVNDLDDLFTELEQRGYSIKRDKYLYIKAPEQQRSVSLWKLGEDYTEYSLKARILWRSVGQNDELHFTNSEIERAYLDVIGSVRILAEQRRKVPRRQNIMLPYGANNDLDCYRLSAQMVVMNQDRICSMGDLEGRIRLLYKEYKREQEELSALLLEQEKEQALLEQCEYYYANWKREDMSPDEKTRFEICRSAMRTNGMLYMADYDKLRNYSECLQKKIEDRKEKLSRKKNKLVRYVDIFDTYSDISHGDYVSNLIKEENIRREQEKQKENKNHIKKKGRR